MLDNSLKFSNLNKKDMPTIGIYMIKNPKGRIYIGQSKNIEYRFKKYRLLNGGLVGQTRLYHSLKKYGWETHLFEIVKVCDIEHLNFWESHFIKAFNSFNTPNGMNLTSGGNSCVMSDETKAKISTIARNRSQEIKAKMGKTKIGNKNMLGKTHTEETKAKIRQAKTGLSPTLETRIKMRSIHLGFKHTECSCAKMSANSTSKKKVIDTKTKHIYYSVKEAAEANNLKNTTLIAMLKGQNKNKTTLQYI